METAWCMRATSPSRRRGGGMEERELEGERARGGLPSRVGATTVAAGGDSFLSEPSRKTLNGGAPRFARAALARRSASSFVSFMRRYTVATGDGSGSVATPHGAAEGDGSAREVTLRSGIDDANDAPPAGAEVASGDVKY